MRSSFAPALTGRFSHTKTEWIETRAVAERRPSYSLSKSCQWNFGGGWCSDLRRHAGDATVCQSQRECELRICHATEFHPHTGWVTITVVINSHFARNENALP